MLQLVYISTPRGTIDMPSILAVSRRNNRRAGVTGLLYHDGRRFLQALEGEAAAVEETFGRIRADPRHCAVVLLSRREIDRREFGAWQMAERRPDDDGDVFASVRSLVADASPAVRGTFEGFVRLERAA